jgi:hypothetical protein
MRGEELMELEGGELVVGTDVVSFAEKILHGDVEHRAWIMEAAKAFVHGEPIPEIREGKLTEEQVQDRFKQMWREGNPFYEAAKTSSGKAPGPLPQGPEVRGQHLGLWPGHG